MPAPTTSAMPPSVLTPGRRGSAPSPAARAPSVAGLDQQRRRRSGPAGEACGRRSRAPPSAASAESGGAGEQVRAGLCSIGRSQDDSSAGGGLAHPGEVRLAAVGDRQHEQLRHVCTDAASRVCALSASTTVAHGLDHELLLARFRDRALPPVDGRHRRTEHAHARRQALVHQQAPERLSVGISGKRRQDDDGSGRHAGPSRVDSIVIDFPCTNAGDLGYNSCSMPATRATSPPAHCRARRAEGAADAGVSLLALVLARSASSCIDGLAGERGTLALVRARRQIRAAGGAG